VSSFIGCEQSVVIIEEYDKKSLFPTVFKCHHHLHSLAKFQNGLQTKEMIRIVVDIFEMIVTQMN
jgi:hypothetical protein